MGGGGGLRSFIMKILWSGDLFIVFLLRRIGSLPLKGNITYVCAHIANAA